MTGSNQRDMIYIDTNPGMDNGRIESSVTTLAHEMQHLMNFVTTLVTRSVIEDNMLVDFDLMDTWIDEGLSSAAEYIINGHSTDRISWYNENGSISRNLKGLIDQGNNFYVWGNHTNNQYAVLDDYATVYLFFQWLRIHQIGGSNIWRDIISSSHYDYQSVTAAMNNESWDNLLRDWMAANYINNSTGVYGYKEEITITANYAPKTASISLFPGEGVYSLINSQYYIPGSSNNIRYALLDKNTGNVSIGGSFSSGALLTYNKNIKIEAVSETGTTTGEAPSADMSAARSAAPSYSGPFRIGAGDMLRMNGGKKEFQLLDFLNRLKEDAIVE
jgi:hypothetical protein